MKSVLCYGDSNTWGYNPVTKGRYDRSLRWTRVLQRLLGDDYEVIEEGQNGRTTVHDDPVEGQKNGMSYLVPCLESHKPVDLVVLMLGTNNLKRRFAEGPGDIARSVGRLVQVVQTCEFGPAGAAPKVLLLAPPPVGRLTEFGEIFAGAVEKSRGLGEAYRLIAREKRCGFLDTAGVIRSSDVDGIHLDAVQLSLLAEAVKDAVLSVFG
ncbi:MAG: SGNH/GDSL hydrolase family protein [Alkalispirochaeta sp.]